MHFRWSVALALALTATSFGSSAEPEAPNVLLRVESFQQLLADIKYVIALQEGEQSEKKIDGVIDGIVGQDRAGLDITKPAGLYSTVTEKNAGVETLVVLLPIKDEMAFLKWIERWCGAATKKEDGLYELKQNFLVPHYLRFANQYVYFSWDGKDTLYNDKLANPPKLFATDRPVTLSLAFFLDRIPDSRKEQAIGSILLESAAIQEKLPGETELQRKLRVKVTDNISAWLKAVQKEGSLLELRAGVDRKSDELFTEFTLNAKPKTKLAESIAELGRTKSRFAALPSNNSAMSFLLHWFLNEEVTDAFRPVVDEAIRRIMQNAPAEVVRDQSAKLTDALDPTLKPGELDLGVSLIGPAADKRYNALVGIKVRNGQRIDEAVRSLVKSLPERDRARIRFDAMILDKKPIHRADVQEVFNESMINLFGNAPVYFAMENDSVWLAFGPDALKVLKESLAASAQTGPQLQYELSLARFAPLLARDEKSLEDILKKSQMIFGQMTDADRVRLTIQGGNALQGRVSSKANALKFLNAVEQYIKRPYWLFWF